MQNSKCGLRSIKIGSKFKEQSTSFRCKNLGDVGENTTSQTCLGEILKYKKGGRIIRFFIVKEFWDVKIAKRARRGAWGQPFVIKYLFDLRVFSEKPLRPH
jgi:hypothetical protein